MSAPDSTAAIRWDVKGVMALRAPDFHTVGPDGATRDRAAMEQYTRGLLNGIKQWTTLTQTIDSLQVEGDTAIVTMSQHLDRRRVDQVRDQRRLVDGKPG